MNLKDHILAALSEQYQQYEAFIASLEGNTSLCSESLRDLLIHLWAWQVRTNARLKAAAYNDQPNFRLWPSKLDPDNPEGIDKINVWVFDTYQNQPWLSSYQNWQEGFQSVLAYSAEIPEEDLLDPGRYTWMDGKPLVFILLATYQHHQEHFKQLCRPFLA